ncbi:hypothetical protein GUJ93_ZPchr0009g1642 [Zizania palustris]|uniref:Uncharacterized protein n=1 Tax=Zizania palustris TaxID=103762 RepID=A0A8J5R3K5_ZIZPA|nr:hypothetical protein GUJ93_ZPchr0009g1642 [Zizania palustris]
MQEQKLAWLAGVPVNYSNSISNYKPDEGNSLTDHIGMADTRPCLLVGSSLASSRSGRRRTKHVYGMFVWTHGHMAERATASCRHPRRRPVDLYTAEVRYVRVA